MKDKKCKITILAELKRNAEIEDERVPREYGEKVVM